MLGTVGTYTLSTADDAGLGQLAQRTYAAIVSADNDDGTVHLHFFLAHNTNHPVLVRRFIPVGKYGKPGTFSPNA